MKSIIRMKRIPYPSKLKFDFSFTSKSPYPRDVPLAKKTLKIAQHNSNASRLLFTQGFTTEAIFFLQQSVEKGCKAYGYFYGLIDEDLALKKISHHSAKVYSRSLFEYEKILEEAKKMDEQNRALRFINRLELPVFSHMDERIQDALDIHKSIDTPQFSPEKNEVRLTELTADEITFAEQVKKQTDQFTSDVYVQKIQQMFDIELDQRERDMLTKFRWFYRHNFRVRYKIKEAFKSFRISPPMKKMDWFKDAFFRLSTSRSLLLLGCITQPHEASTRYASSKSNFDPLDYYSENLSIVQSFPTLADICKEDLVRLDEIFQRDEKAGVKI